MPVDTRHSDYDKWFTRWELVRDGIAGEDDIKAKTTTYLPKLGGQETDAYNAYLSRAKYYNVSGRILEVAIGQLFRKEPVFLEGYENELFENINLAGESFSYLSRDIAEEIMKVNRVGVLVDWSQEQGRPYLTVYKAENIINWQTAIIDGEVKTTLIMLEGTIVEPEMDDPYKVKTKKIWHELYIEDDIYKSRKWIKTENSKMSQVVNKVFGKAYNDFELVEDSEATPMKNDKTLDFIPFFVLTTNGISLELMHSPMSPIVKINLGHYVNSADYENMLHWTGARTIIAKGWKKGETFPIGGCAVFPVDGDAHFLEASSDSALEEGMKHKEEQMSVLGSAMITGKGRYVASAKTAEVTSQGEYATLADVANALSDSMTKILNVMDEWMKQDSKKTGVTYNTDYDLTEANIQEIVSLSGLVQSNLMSWKTFFHNLKKREIYQDDWSIEDEEKAIEETLNKQIENREKKTPELYMNNQDKEDEQDVQGIQ